MTKGELISACLKLMFDTDNTQINPSIVSDLPEYESRTILITESINRVFHRIESSSKLPKKTVLLDLNTPNVKQTGYKTTYNLSEIIPDILHIDRISYTRDSDNFLKTNIGYITLNTNTVILERLFKEDENYIIYYRPRIEELSYSDSDDKIIDLPSNILSIVPYGVKADLYEEENPNIALANREMFEKYLALIPIQEEDRVQEIGIYFSY